MLQLSMIRFSSELTLSIGGLEDVLKRHPCGGVKSNPCCSYLGRIFARHLRLVFRIMGLSAPATRRKFVKTWPICLSAEKRYFPISLMQDEEERTENPGDHEKKSNETMADPECF